MARIIREQDTDLVHYEPQDVPTGTTVEEARNRYRDELNINDNMLAVVNGQPAPNNYRLEANDVLYLKEQSKARGLCA